ncbi:hypothetical protein NZ698_11425 [Chryseobacterium sp. PBS4-4]|uniref:DUF4595 domain-containing protein n=1 Tax=Chryseobacterium edaphi TaxID=2976532 RepID=A0ABT2WB01_9FLAO|nr:hypothetical protein [Chryseobacterium edaphi]MCU7617810.1 hypothetical protein [Chryseobacterium edaphi]
MIRKNFFKVVAALLLSFTFSSCDNTTNDPINNNTNNPSTGGSGSGSGTTGPTITGPRILHKIVVNNVTNQEFVTTGNVLQKAIFQEASGPTSFFIGTPTYTSGKITKVKFGQEINGAVPANNIAYDFDITYDSSGKINYTSCQTTLGGAPHFGMEYTYTYDSSGKMTKIVEKKKSGTTYIQFTNYTFTNTGDNITKVVAENGTTSATGVPNMSTLMSAGTYNYPLYDDKINPYTTLPKTFFVMWSLVHPTNFQSLSANNVKSFNIVFPPIGSVPAPLVSGDFTYIYDSMNYPVSDQGQAQKYIYKAL